MAVVDASPVRPGPTARERRADLVLALVILIGAVLSATLSAIGGIYGDEQGSMQLALVYAIVLAVPLAFRRRWPATVAVIISAAYFVAVTLRVPEVYVGNIAMFIALYTVGAWMTNRRSAMLVRVTIIFGMFVWLTISTYGSAMEEAAKAEIAAGFLSPYLAFMLLQVMLNVLYFCGAYYC